MTDECGLCGLPLDPWADVVVIPKAKVCPDCFERDGRTLPELSEAVPCCSSRRVLASFGGSIHERKDGIPANEIWMADPENHRIVRVQVFDLGPVPVAPLPPITRKRRAEDAQG